MARSPIKVASESDVTPRAEETLDFDDDIKRAIAQVYKNEGNDEYRKRDFSNATYFYTEGIKVNCKDDELNAKLYSNRAIAHFYLENYRESLSDAKVATELQPSFIKAFVRGASACVELKQFEEAITWCVKGLAIDNNHKELLELRSYAEEKAENKASEVIDNKPKHPASIERDPVKAVRDCDVTTLPEGTLDFNDDTLRAIAEVYLDDGKGQYRENNFDNAISFYTEGIKVNCKDDELNAKLYSYRALANFYLGNDDDSLSDARTATKFLNAIDREASTFMGLNQFEEATVWCKADSFQQKKKLSTQSIDTSRGGEAINYYNLILCVAKAVEDKAAEKLAYHYLGTSFFAVGDFKNAMRCDIEWLKLDLSIAKEEGNKAREGDAYGSLGNAFHRLGDYKNAIDCHNQQLGIAQELGNKAVEGDAYCNIGNAFQGLSEFKKAIEYHNLHLSITKEMGDKAGEGGAYSNIGNAFQDLGDFKKAIDFHNLHLSITKEMGDKPGEGRAYGHLGNAFQGLSEFKRAIEYHILRLSIAKKVGDKAEERRAYGNLGNDFYCLGNFKKATEYHNLDLNIAKEVKDKDGEKSAYCNLGCSFDKLGDFQKAIKYHNLHLSMSKEVGDKAGEGRAYGNLGNAFYGLANFKQAIEYHNLSLGIAKDLGDKTVEGNEYGSLGNAFYRLGDFKNAMEYHSKSLCIAKVVGNKALEGKSYHALGQIFEKLCRLPEALENFQSCVTMFNMIRDRLQSKDEWKIDFRNQYNAAYTSLWRVLLKQDHIVEAVVAANEGRAQALTDLMESKYQIQSSHSGSHGLEKYDHDMLNCTSSSTVFQALDSGKINFWVLSAQGNVNFTPHNLPLSNDEMAFFTLLIQAGYQNIGVRAGVQCEDRSMDAVREDATTERSTEESSQLYSEEDDILTTLYDLVIKPIADLVQGEELIIVPDGPLWLAPYAAFVDTDSKYLCESFRIRLIPSLTSLKMIADCSNDYHSRIGALLVGNPWVEEVTNSKGEHLLEQLVFAEQEVRMIGDILKVSPLIGKEATKAEVLRRLNSVALVHIAAHGCMETGEIALTPDPKRTSLIPRRRDYVLTMADVLSVQLRARLVVLSCCHSGRGEIKAEGVVGIARAFMGAGARSVLVSLWAIDDEATLEFMRRFYHRLVEGKSAGESMNQAMKDLRESDKYSDVKYWAPFVLIGDDVTLEFDERK
ncbi:uncharacterized protein LOC144647020 isoform X1 [Oculina patagonica]